MVLGFFNSCPAKVLVTRTQGLKPIVALGKNAALKGRSSTLSRVV